MTIHKIRLDRTASEPAPQERRGPAVLRRTTIATRLAVLAAAAVLGMAAAGAVGAAGMRHTLASLRRLGDQDRSLADAADMTRRAQVGFKRQVQEWKDVLLRGHDPALREKHFRGFVEREAEVQATLGALRDTLAALRLDAGEVERLRLQHAALGARYRQALAAGFTADPLSYRAVDAAVKGVDREPTAHMDSVVARVRRVAAARHDALVQAEYAASHRATLLLGALVLAAVALVLAAAHAIARSIVEPIASVVRTAEQVASGDLRRRMGETSGDEMGRMGAAFDRMIVHLHGLLGPIRDTGEHLLRTSTELGAMAAETESAVQSLAGTVTQITAGAQEQAASAGETARAVETISAAVGHIDGEAREVVESALRTAGAVRDGGEAVRRIVREVGDVAHECVAAAERVGGLRRYSGEVGSFVRVIREIAGQTNLLALNAAIEAARAGDAGRGFAVVAEEVRRLAAHSAASALRVAELVDEMRGDIEGAVAAIEAGTDRVRATSARALALDGALEQIEAALADTHDRAREIAGSAAGVSAEVRNVAGLSDRVAAVAAQNAASAGELAALSEQVAATVEHLGAIAAGGAGAPGDARRTSLSTLASGLGRLVSSFELDQAA